MNIDGKITLLIDKRGTTIEIFDENSRMTFVKITLTPEQLSDALSRLAYTKCEKMEVNGLDKVGKKMEHKSFEFKLPEHLNANKYSTDACNDELHEYAQSLLNNEGEGYIADNYFGSHGTFFYKNNEQYVRVIVRRWI